MGTARAFPNRNTARGVRHGLAKLDPDKVREIRRKWAAREATIMDLAIEYDVSNGTLSAVIYRKTWRHVDG